MAVGGTDRDWHAHGPAEAGAGRDGTCAPDGGEGAGDPSGAPDGDGTIGGDGGDTPATGGGAALAGAVAVGALLGASRR